MANREYSGECAMTCWGIAALAGAVSMVLLYWMAGFGALQALFIGGLIGTVLGVVLALAVCGSQTAALDLASADKPALRRASLAAGHGAHAPQTDAADAQLPAAPMQTSVVASPAPQAVPVPAATSTPQVLRSSAAPATKNNTVPAAMASGETVPVAIDPVDQSAVADVSGADEKPAVLMDTARAGGRDDLKLISGVGPKLEQTLNDLGIYHFDQIAQLKKKDIAWVDARVRFKGRIVRDDWMSQAAILASGGEAEFSKGKKKT
jgi:predicted flap endonuclease-1-like 5' DNA nuclease